MTHPGGITPQDLWDYTLKAQEEVKKFTLAGDPDAALKWAEQYCLRYKAYVKLAAEQNELRLKYNTIFG